MITGHLHISTRLRGKEGEGIGLVVGAMRDIDHIAEHLLARAINGEDTIPHTHLIKTTKGQLHGWGEGE